MPSQGLREFQKNQVFFSFTFTPDNPMTAVVPTSSTDLGSGPGSATRWTANYGAAANQNAILASDAFVPYRYRQNGLDNLNFGLHCVNLDGVTPLIAYPRYRVYGRLPGGSLWHNAGQLVFSPAVSVMTGTQSAAQGTCPATLSGRWNWLGVSRFNSTALYPEMYVTLDTAQATITAASTERFRFDLYISE